MKNEIGLKGFYRFLGISVAKFLKKHFKPFNPTIITVCGFLVYILTVSIFAIFGKKGVNNIYLFIFIVGTQLALILDFTDGSYARMVNRTSYSGHVWDIFSGILETIILFGLIYFKAEGPIEQFIIVSLMLIYVLNQKIKFSLSSRMNFRTNGQEERLYQSSKINISYIIRIPFGFGLAHFYLYVTLWFLFDFLCFLLVLHVVGLFSFFNIVINSLSNNHKKA